MGINLATRRHSLLINLEIPLHFFHELPKFFLPQFIIYLFFVSIMIITQRAQQLIFEQNIAS